MRLNPYCMCCQINKQEQRIRPFADEEKKLIYTPSTSGKYVTNDINVINSYKKKYLKNKTNEYLNTLRELGITNEEVMDYLREEMK